MKYISFVLTGVWHNIDGTVALKIPLLTAQRRVTGHDLLIHKL